LPVKEIRAVGLPILSGKVDIATCVSIRIRMRGELHRQPRFDQRVRKLRFSNPDNTSRSIMDARNVLVFSVGDDPEWLPSQRESTDSVGKPSIQPRASRGRDPVFLHCVSDRSQPVVSLEDGAAPWNWHRRFLSTSSDMPEK